MSRSKGSRRGAGAGPLGLSLGSGSLGAVGVGLLSIAASAAVAGTHGAVSALCGLGVVVLFFVLSLYLVEVANRVAPSLTLPVGLTVYGTLVLWLGLLAFGTSLPDRLHRGSFAWTVIAATLGWLLAQAAAVWRWRVPYVDVVLPTVSGDHNGEPPFDAGPPARSVTDTRP